MVFCGDRGDWKTSEVKGREEAAPRLNWSSTNFSLLISAAHKKLRAVGSDHKLPYIGVPKCATQD